MPYTLLDIKDALRDVRMALLEADVALPVVQDFIARVRDQAVGQDVLKSLSPGQELIRVVRDELTLVMGERGVGLDLSAPAPVVVMMAGLQGSGKTTTTGKLAKLLKEKQGKKVLVVSCDVYRPAAIEQLRTVAAQVDVAFFDSTVEQDPVDIARNALSEARLRFYDVLLVDTAGRLHIDEQMMAEVKAIHEAVRPHETLFVADSMSGQDAARSSKAFDDALALTGVVLTKIDGDARGGAALSIRHVTGKPIKLVWATCSVSSRTLNRKSIAMRRKNSQRNCKKAKASTSRTSPNSCGKCEVWAESSRCSINYRVSDSCLRRSKSRLMIEILCAWRPSLVR